jgi:hypothetical protein
VSRTGGGTTITLRLALLSERSRSAQGAFRAVLACAHDLTTRSALLAYLCFLEYRAELEAGVDETELRQEQ